MGLFGDKDLSKLKEEVIALRVAVRMRPQLQDTSRLDQGVDQAKRDISRLFNALVSKGLADKAREVVMPLTQVAEIQHWVTELLDSAS